MKGLFQIIILNGLYLIIKSQDCTPKAQNRCLALLDMDELPVIIIPNYAQDIIRKNCEQYTLFSKCMTYYVLKYCPLQLQLQYQGLDDAYTFLCKDGFLDYVRYQPCFASADVQKGASYCNTSFLSRFIDLHQQQITDSNYIAARTCQFVDDYIDCESNLLKSFCNGEAATWQRTFASALWRPMLISSECPDWNTLPATDEATTLKSPITMPVEWIIIISMAIAICGILIVTGIVFLACLKLRKIRADRRDSWRSSHSIDMPPPYPGPFILYPSEEDQIASTVYGDSVEVQAFKPPSYQSSLDSIPFETGFSNDAYSPLNDDDSIVIRRMDGNMYDEFEDEDAAGIAIGAVGGSPVPTAYFSQPSPPTMMSYHSDGPGAAASGGCDIDRFHSQHSEFSDYY